MRDQGTDGAYYPYYTAAIVQGDQWDCGRDRSSIKRNLDRALMLVDAASQLGYTARSTHGEGWAPCKLVCFTEFFLQGSSARLSFDDYMNNVVIRLPGPETEVLGEKARELGVWIAGQALEHDAHWDDRFFNTAFIIGPDGTLIHKYRKVQSAVNYELAISPHDMLDEYMRVYGEGRSSREVLFPVADLPIGRVATMTCNDGFYPEIARALALNGAEIITHPQMPDPFVSSGMWLAQNRSRALENAAYILAPNRAELFSDERPKSHSPGGSHIVDFNGEPVAVCNHGGETVLSTTVYLDALRRRRMDPSWNFLTQLRTETFRAIYDESIYPPNMFADAGPTSRSQRDSVMAIEHFKSTGRFAPPLSDALMKQR